MQRSRPEQQVLFDWYPSGDSDARVDASIRLTVGVSFKKASRRLASKRARAGRRLSSFRRLFGPMLHPRNYTRPRTRNACRSHIYFDRFKIYSDINRSMSFIPRFCNNTIIVKQNSRFFFNLHFFFFGIDKFPKLSYVIIEILFIECTFISFIFFIFIFFYFIILIVT